MIRREQGHKKPLSTISKRAFWGIEGSPVGKGLIFAFPLFIVYLVWFFSQPGSFGASRLHDMVGLLLPDDLLRSTAGGGAEHLQIGILDRLPILLSGLIWLGLGYWIGRPFVMPFGRQISRIEYVSLCTMIGLSLLSTATLVTGMLGWLHNRWLVVPVLGLCCISYILQRLLCQRLNWRMEPSIDDEVSGHAAVHSPDSQRSAVPSIKNPHRCYSESAKEQLGDNLQSHTLPCGQTTLWVWRMVQVSTVALGVAYILSAMMPPFEFDVVEYHLQGPKEFYQTGRIGFVPHNVYLNMPLGSEMHSLAAMALNGGEDAWWFGALVGKLVIGSFSLISACLAAGFLSRHFGNIAGWSAAAVILASPGNLHVAGCGLVDSVLGATLLATVVALQVMFKLFVSRDSESLEKEHQRESQQDFTNGNDHSGLMAAACSASILAGAAAACKYTGLVFAWFPTVMLLCWCCARQPVCGVRYPFAKIALIVTAGFAVTVGPWFAKNLVGIGNPVFPLAHRWLGCDAPPWTNEQAERWMEAHRVPLGPTIPGWAVTSPFGLRAFLGVLHRIGVGSPMLPPALIPLSVLGLFWYGYSVYLVNKESDDTGNSKESSSRGPRTALLAQPLAIPVLVATWIFAIWWLGTHRIDRFWLPTLPLIALLAGMGAHWTVCRGGMRLVAGLLLLSNGYGLYMGLTGSLCDQRWFVSLNSLRSDHGTEDQPGRIPKTTAWINHHLSPEHRILVIGEARVFDFQPAIEYATYFNTPPGKQELEGKSATEQLQWLEQNGITHVFVHWREISRYRSPGNYGFSSWPDRLDIEEMLRGGVLHTLEDWPFVSEEAVLLKTKE